MIGGASEIRNLIAGLVLAVVLTGCTAMGARGLADRVAGTILDSDDPETVRLGAPSYLLFIDGMIAEEPDDPSLLLAGARLYGAYAVAFVTDSERSRRLSAKALDYAGRAVCGQQPALCAARNLPYRDFLPRLGKADTDDLPALGAWAAAWAGWIKARGGDWAALADLPKVEAVCERMVVLDETYEHGQAHLLLGILLTLRPRAVGGKPEQGRAHFERAVTLSEGRNLIAKMELAKRYARLVFDRALHDRLLDEVLAADPHQPGLTLGNVLAQDEARRLQRSAADYFLE